MFNLYILFYIYLAELVDIVTLSKINLSEISTLTKQFPMGIQINFRHNVEIWQKSYAQLNEPNKNIRSPILPSPSCSSALETASLVNNQNIVQPQSIPSKVVNFELCNILNSTQGALIVDYYKSHNCLNDHIRTLLVEIIIQELITKKLLMSVALAENIANQIQQLFSSELKV